MRACIPTHLRCQDVEQLPAKLVDGGGGSGALSTCQRHLLSRLCNGERLALQQLAPGGACRRVAGRERGSCGLLPAEGRQLLVRMGYTQGEEGARQASHGTVRKSMHAVGRGRQGSKRSCMVLHRLPGQAAGSRGAGQATAMHCGARAGAGPPKSEGARRTWRRRHPRPRCRALACGAVRRLNREQQHARERKRGAHPRHHVLGAWCVGGLFLSNWRPRGL